MRSAFDSSVSALAVLRCGCSADLTGESWGPFVVRDAPSLEGVAAALSEQAADALLIRVDDAAAVAAWPGLSHAVLDAAVVIATDAAPPLVTQLLRLGVQDVLPSAADGDAMSRAIRLAVERKLLERAARTAYATDLSTGLPNHAQLLEHMTHLVALREREPAPMALIVLRVQGLARVADALGTESVNVLRRKAAVRLRAALRASDVVAAIGNDAYAVLLAYIETASDGERVASKLAQALAQPFSVAGRTQTLSVDAGLGSYPEHGKDADALLRRALGQAATIATVGAAGTASSADRGPAAAANDDEV